MDREPLETALVDEDSAGAGPAPELVVITGMSGAGRSEAIHTFEDLGYFCIDNLPPHFLPQVVQLAALPGSRVRRAAVVCDVRAAEFFDQLVGELKVLEDTGVSYHLLFLEADTDRLLKRFKETRRRHPLVREGESLVDGIRAERDELSSIRAKADVIIDTTKLKPADLRRAIRERYAGDLAQTLSITVSSFGFKYGLPIDADIVMDVRFLPNPYYLSELREHTGLDAPVREFVLGRAETEDFLGRWLALLDAVVPAYIEEGKQHLSIALGCTGGMHRSVVLAETTGLHLREHGWRVSITHRDIDRDRERS